MTDLVVPLRGDPLGRSLVSLSAIEQAGVSGLNEAPLVTRLMVENIVRQACGAADSRAVDKALGLARQVIDALPGTEVALAPTRVLLQDHSGIPVLADLAALRMMCDAGGRDPSIVAPRVPVDLVVDHSVEAWSARSPHAATFNAEREYRVNGERYRFLRWASQAWPTLRVVPPGAGIVHEINLEHLAPVVCVDREGLLAPEFVIGTDSHTTMMNGLGVVGWGVGGLEATSVLLGRACTVALPDIVAVYLQGRLPAGTLATDAALAMTEFLRARGVVDRIVEFHGLGASALSLPDRATISNMAPEYGCTAAYFAVDENTLAYLLTTGRTPQQVKTVAAYMKQQGLFGADHGRGIKGFREVYRFDLSSVEASVAGPRRPQDRMDVGRVPEATRSMLGIPAGASPHIAGVESRPVADGDIAIAAIASCTNTANPTAMVTAGLLAGKAARLGLRVPRWVKSSLAPGSRALSEYMERRGLLEPLAAIGFDVVGFGCTTCIGNSGPLLDDAQDAVSAGRQMVAVLSGNRNFDGRIHRSVSGAFLASPPLVVAFALAGSALAELATAPIGIDRAGNPVRLADLWPSSDEVAATVSDLRADDYEDSHRRLLHGDERWRALDAPQGELYDWPPHSTYLRPSPFVTRPFGPPSDDLDGARVLVYAPDGTTTDHISPAGSIPADSSAGQYLAARGTAVGLLNSYGCRRGNAEVLLRGTFANPRFTNLLTPSRPGAWTTHLDSGEEMDLISAAERYRTEGVPLVILAGRDYGMGSSRDWAARGPRLLGVHAVLAASFERIHRRNLVDVGILPLQFVGGVTPAALGFSGRETFRVRDLHRLSPQGTVQVECVGGTPRKPWPMVVRIESAAELAVWRAGGLLSQFVNDNN